MAEQQAFVLSSDWFSSTVKWLVSVCVCTQLYECVHMFMRKILDQDLINIELKLLQFNYMYIHVHVYSFKPVKSNHRDVPVGHNYDS